MRRHGHLATVVGIDVDPEVIGCKLENAPFYEPGLPELLASGRASGRLSFTTDLSVARRASVHFICVGTPQRAGEYAADVRYVDAALEGLLPFLAPGDIVVGKSTVPVGTAERLAARVHEVSPEPELIWNPKFLREGKAVQDTLSPDRFVYGVNEGEAGAAAADRLDEVYAQALSTRHSSLDWTTGDCPVGQGCRQLVPGHQDLLHQRDGQALRGLWRGCHLSGERDRSTMIGLAESS